MNLKEIIDLDLSKDKGLQAAIKALDAAEAYYLTNAWEQIGDPNRMSDLRLRLSAIVSAISNYYAVARTKYIHVRTEEDKFFLMIKKEKLEETGKFPSDSVAEKMAGIEFFEKRWEAQYWKEHIESAQKRGGEILNALASKIKTLEMQAKNIT